MVVRRKCICQQPVRFVEEKVAEDRLRDRRADRMASPHATFWRNVAATSASLKAKASSLDCQPFRISPGLRGSAVNLPLVLEFGSA